MSVVMKKPLTDINIDGEIFFVPKEQKKAILTIVKGFAEETENPFKELEKALPSSAIVLRGARQKEGLSQQQLSKKTGISATNISKMENGERGIGQSTARKLAKYLKVSYKVFL